MILVLEQSLADYRVPVYRRLQERLAEDVVVFHAAPRPGEALRLVEPGQDTGFHHEAASTRWLPGGRLVLADFRRALRHLARARAVIVRPMIRDLGFFPTAWWVKRRGVPLIGWSHGYSQRRAFAPDRRLRDRGHLAIVRYLDAYICYTDAARRALGEHVDPDRLFVARNDPGTEALIAVRNSLEAEGRAAVRRGLGLSLERYVSFIGRLQERKRPRELLAAYAHLVARDGADLGLVVIGDGPLRPKLERMASDLELEHVHFVGARYGEEAARYLFASDVMAMPGALGLAVPHAFALGVPVVSRYLGEDLVGHGPEAAYIRPGENGEFAPASSDPAALARAIRQVLENRTAYSLAAARYAERSLGLEGMIDGFVDAIAYVTA